MGLVNLVVPSFTHAGSFRPSFVDVRRLLPSFTEFFCTSGQQIDLQLWTGGAGVATASLGQVQSDAAGGVGGRWRWRRRRRRRRRPARRHFGVAVAAQPIRTGEG